MSKANVAPECDRAAIGQRLRTNSCCFTEHYSPWRFPLSTSNCDDPTAGRSAFTQKSATAFRLNNFARPTGHPERPDPHHPPDEASAPALQPRGSGRPWRHHLPGPWSLMPILRQDHCGAGPRAWASADRTTPTFPSPNVNHHLGLKRASISWTRHPMRTYIEKACIEAEEGFDGRARTAGVLKEEKSHEHCIRQPR